MKILKTLTYDETKLRRNYDIKLTTYVRCDLCRRYWKKAFELVPQVKLHSFDSVVLCKNCLTKCELKFLDNIDDVINVVD